MLMKKTILTFNLALISIAGIAQENNVTKCGSDNYYDLHLENHPEVIQERAELQIFTDKFAETFNPLEKTASITIPVVFHINDPSNPQKVTMAQINSALDIVNADFSATNSDVSNIIPEFTSLVADMDINFCLASKDPNGNPTTGVTYHTNNYNGREPDGYGTAVKSVENWPSNKYLNIWVVNYTEDDGSLYNSGWAFLPDSWVTQNNVDGIVYNHRYLGMTGSSDVTPNSQAHMARVLTHEIGHYLNLHHTFKNYCSSPGDEVDDTPYVYYHGSNNCEQLGTFCPTTTVVMDQNYMDYTPCPSMYSLGQKTRVHAALNSTVSGRNNLWTQANLIATGCAVEDVTSVDEIFDENGIKLYPNPFSNDFTLEMTEANVSDIKIYNTLGTLVYSEYIDKTNAIDISLGHLPNGVYFVELSNENKTITKKLIKQ